MPENQSSTVNARPVSELLERARTLRKQEKYVESHALVAQADLSRVTGAHFVEWEHRPFFWQPICSDRSVLLRRGPSDSAFVRDFWLNSKVMENFHRNAPALPASDEHLKRILLGEQTALVSESKSLHWVVHDMQKKPWGLLSLTEISLLNRRAELLFGMLPGAPFGVSVSAVFSLMDFYFKNMQFNKLTSLIYKGNHHSIKSTLHLGFAIEGVLVRHIFDQKRNEFLDVVQTGLLREDYLRSAANPLSRRRNILA